MVATRSASTTPDTFPLDLLRSLPADAEEMAEGCAAVLGMPAVAGALHALLVDLAAVPFVEAIGAVVWSDTPGTPHLTLYPVLDLRRLGDDGAPVNAASELIDDIFERFLLDHWDLRPVFVPTMSYVNSIGKPLSSTLDDIFARIDIIDFFHGSERGSGATATVVVAEIAA